MFPDITKNELKFLHKEQFSFVPCFGNSHPSIVLWDCQCLGDQSKIFRRSRTIGRDAMDLKVGLPLVAGMHKVLIFMLLKTFISSEQVFSVAHPFP